MALVWKCVKYAAFGLACILVPLLIWGVAVEPRLVDFKQEEAFVPNLPALWEGKRVALIADLQIGMWLGNEDAVEKIINRIIEERPAVVLIAGDFVYKPIDEEEREDIEREDVRDFSSEVTRAVAYVRPLAEAGIPTYAVLGNHDYGMGYPDSVKNEQLALALREALSAVGVRVLDNAATMLVLRDENSAHHETAGNADSMFYLVGIGSHYAGDDKPHIALSQVSKHAPRVVFMHHPNSFSALPARSAPLALAAHTHGGQVRIPFFPEWTWMDIFSDEKIQADGWIDGFGQIGNRLYVNRGIGFSTAPVRINCRPELTMFTLRRGNNQGQ